MKYIGTLIFVTGLFGIVSMAADRYEAEMAIVDENSVVIVEDTEASGGSYVNMKEGALLFEVNVELAGFYTLWMMYSQPNDENGKIQNLSVNGVAVGQVVFPGIDTFVIIKASSKIRLAAGGNTIEILKSWGWVNIDYIELTPYEATPFSLPSRPVTPDASESVCKLYSFLREQFQKKVISGVMTNRVMENDGKYTPNTVQNQEEIAWIINASGKTPALIGFDFMHATGKNSESEWHRGYTSAAVALAEDVFNHGGIPAYCWHWKDPSGTVEAFYSPSADGQTSTDFDLTRVFTDPATCSEFNTESSEYKAIINDLDVVAGYLKRLEDKGVAVLWRPLHEASGKWFWWGYKGPEACRSLYLLIFDYFTNHHGLKNLIWVWTTDEAGDALDWYPGDEYVDIIGRDYYYYPREANHGSLVSSFEKVKDIFGGRKIIALSENGSVPFPDEMEEDGAGWAYFMPWYGDYTMDGWAHDNTAVDWKKILNHDFVLTLDEMPGWNNYSVPVTAAHGFSRSPKKGVIRRIGNELEYIPPEIDVLRVELYSGNGCRIAATNRIGNTGVFRLGATRFASGIYLVKAVRKDRAFTVNKVIIR